MWCHAIISPASGRQREDDFQMMTSQSSLTGELKAKILSQMKYLSGFVDTYGRSAPFWTETEKVWMGEQRGGGRGTEEEEGGKNWGQDVK